MKFTRFMGANGHPVYVGVDEVAGWEQFVPDNAGPQPPGEVTRLYMKVPGLVLHVQATCEMVATALDPNVPNDLSDDQGAS